MLVFFTFCCALLMPDSLADLRRAVAQDPKSAAAHMRLGEAYLAQGSPELISEAKAEFQQALDLDPTLIWARFYLAKIYMDLGRLDSGKHELERANLQRPGVPHILSLLGEIERRLGNATVAAELNSKALQADRTFTPAHYYRGLAYLDLKREQDAIQEIEAALRSKWVTAEMVATLGSLYVKRDTTRAIDTLKKAAAMDPSRLETHLKLAEAYRVARQFDRAQEELKLAMPQPGRMFNTAYMQRLQADVEYETGRLHDARGDSKAARAAWQRALAVDPQHEGAQRALTAAPQ